MLQEFIPSVDENNCEETVVAHYQLADLWTHIGAGQEVTVLRQALHVQGLGNAQNGQCPGRLRGL